MADSNNLVLPVGYTPASVLVNATGDAMNNIFDILIDWPWEGSTNGSVSTDSEAQVSYRADGFDIPEPKTHTYDVTWHGVKVKKVSTGIELDRSFSLDFRLDANYALYQKFIAWRKLVGDVNTSGVANTESALGRVQVIAPGAEYNSLSWTAAANNEDTNLLSKNALAATNLVWTFEDVQAVNIGTPTFKNEATGNKMSYKVEFTFGDVAYPFYTSTAANVTHNHKQS